MASLKEYDVLPHGSVWAPGTLKRLPWGGFVALSIGFSCMVGAGAVLFYSNEVEKNAWPSASTPIQPHVALAVLAVVANVAFRYALSEGVRNAWWIRADRGTTMGDLHRLWAYGSSFKQSLFSGPSFNTAALACIVTSLVIIDIPLLQRATDTAAWMVAVNTTVSVNLSPEQLPNGYSGLWMTNGDNVDVPSFAFSQVLQNYTSRSPIRVQQQGCTGTCYATVEATGFDINCTTMQTPYHVRPNAGPKNFSAPVDVGGINLIHYSKDSGNLGLNVSYKGDSRCDGNLTVTTCSLQLARVRYPVRIDYDDYDTDWSRVNLFSTDRNDTVEVYYPGKEQTGVGRNSTLGGFYLAASELFASTVQLSYMHGQWAIGGNGTMRYTYLDSPGSIGKCNATWTDPTPYVLTTLRELMFRAAVSATNASTFQDARAVNAYDAVVYVSHYRYLGLAAALMALDLLVIFPLFFGWWKLGRGVSMSPLEIAKAFRSPILTRGGSNDEVEALLKAVGNHNVRYGVVASTEEAEQMQAAFLSMQDKITYSGNVEGSPEILGMGYAGETMRPRNGRVYG